MKKLTIYWLVILLFGVSHLCMAEGEESSVSASPTADFYSGDSSVYNGSASGVAPNIMLVFDVSPTMTVSGAAIKYDPDMDYITKYEELSGETSYFRDKGNSLRNLVYTINSETATIPFSKTKMYIDNSAVGSVPVTCPEALAALQENGIWSKVGYVLDEKTGACVTTEKTSTVTYYTGNHACMLVEYTKIAFSSWSDSTEYKLGDIISVGDINDDNLDDKFVCYEATDSNEDEKTTSGPTPPDWNLTDTTIPDNEITWKRAESALSVAVDVLKFVANAMGSQVRLGAAAMGDAANKGAKIYVPLIQPDTEEKLALFNNAIDLLNRTARVEGNHQPVNESLWDVGTYYEGSWDFISPANESTYDYTSQYWCQPNHVILVTTSLEEASNSKLNDVGDLDKDSVIGSSKDLALHLYGHLSPDPSYMDTTEHPYRVKTHVVQLFSELQDLKDVAADGHGAYYYLESAEKLKTVLLQLITSLLEADSSFVAPVVPASPDNRAYSGDKIYLGFFKPMMDEPWYGNLKKFGLGTDSQIKGFPSLAVDDTATDQLINATDDDGYFLVDDTEAANPAVRSFWKSVMDGGEVNLGGVGQQVLTQVGANISASTRTIYTRTETAHTNASESENGLVAFNTTNVSASQLGLTEDADTSELVNFIKGYTTTESATAARTWPLGDIIHSKPVVLHYKTGEDENGKPTTESTIFVGSNDGMLHAFNDTNGQERWAFIPRDLLQYLQYVPDTEYHTLGVDNSPVIYHKDVNNDGLVDSTDDTAILICGMRRGGGASTIPTTDTSPIGSYFALDISNPASPFFRWEINSSVTGFSEMGQTWSVPRLSKVRIGSETKVVAIIGAGYDTNEDLRFGANQYFPDDTTATTVTSLASNGADISTSLGTSANAPDETTDAFKPRGRGIYVVDVLTGALIWGQAFADYAIPSDPMVIDVNSDSYADRIYVGDTGGRIWRIDISSNNSEDWTDSVTCIFNANDTSANGTDIGRKTFYKPTATIDGNDTFIYFGTGDREHPLNTAVIDRFYVVRDRYVPGATEAQEETLNLWDYGTSDAPTPLTEHNLVDVTLDELQNPYPDEVSEEDKALIRAKLTGDYTVETTTTVTENETEITLTAEKTFYGWYIQLTEGSYSVAAGDGGHTGETARGEKILALPKVIENILFFTTYTPAIVDKTDPDYDPCVGVLGPSRLYAVNAKTGESIFNFATFNDTEIESEDGKLLDKFRRDRHLNVGDGIASEPLIIVSKTGGMSILVGRGGGFFNTGDIGKIDPVFPIYWMKW
ncbi:MAG: hypothetical protein JXR59_03255 [Desulfuromonadaceae bacterium]|nr:hypothetical protein [Desulfuromonadaceae bacterium]